MKVIIKTIPHKKQRYETCGDWFRDKKGNLIINVSDMGDDRYAYLVAIHELVETLICEHDGIKEKDVTAFDIAFEKKSGPDSTDEPGDDPDAPYVRQQCIATAVERLLAAEIGVKWNHYADAIDALFTDGAMKS